MPRPDWVEVGRVQRAHGIRGEVRVASSTDNPDRFVPGETVYARDARPGVIRARRAAAVLAGDADRLPLEIEDARGTYENPIIAFVGVDTREQAEGLRGFVLEVPGDQLPDLEDGEYYLCDLEGLEVRVASGGAASEPGRADAPEPQPRDRRGRGGWGWWPRPSRASPTTSWRCDWTPTAGKCWCPSSKRRCRRSTWPPAIWWWTPPSCFRPSTREAAGVA